jgi:hypothetical protein
MRRSRRRHLTALVGLVLVLTACGGDADADDEALPEETTTTTEADEVEETTTSTTEAEATPESEVTEAYLVAWDALLAATNPPDPASVELVAHVSGPALVTARQRAERLQAEGAALFGTAEHDVEVRTVDDTAAVLWDCSNDRLYEAPATEPPDPDVDPVLLGHEAHMVNTPEGWKLDALFDSEDACAGR